MNFTKLLLLSIAFLIPHQVCAIPSFPGAQGGGANSVGGRGGSVIIVNTLADSGTGSLRACVELNAVRTCVFRVSGTIQLLSTLRVNNPFLTIAGQTAPGGGITLSGKNLNASYVMITNANNMVIRYIRLRKGYTSGGDDTAGNLLIATGSNNSIVDHVSSSWNMDEGLGTNSNTSGINNVTFSYNLQAEPLSVHPTQFFSAGSGVVANIDFHHNLAMNGNHRVPLVRNMTGRWVNNLAYNHSYFWTMISSSSSFDVIGNKYKRGPRYGQVIPGAHEITVCCGSPSIYLSGNIGWNQTNPAGDQYLMASDSSAEGGGETGPVPTGERRFTPLSATPNPIVADPVASVESVVLPIVGASRRLDCNGNWVSNRDSLDTGLVTQYQNDTGLTFLVDNESQVGGYPVLASGAVCADADFDGMPDVYETANGLNPNNAADRNGIQPSGFTNLEVFLSGGSIAVPTAPSASITSPATGAVVSGSAVSVSANASDDVAVLGVQFKVDGVNLGAEDTSFPYSVSWNTTGFSDAAHTLTAVARDASTTTTSSPVTVTVNNAAPDTTLPAVSITAPSNGATVSGNVTVSANASDNVGVAGVQFKYGSTNIGIEVLQAPYSASWNTALVPNGSYVLTATARDAAGNTRVSTAVNVTTNNAAVTSFTMGETEILTRDDCCNGNLLLASRETLLQAATVQSISFYTSNTSGNLRLGVYDSTGPGGGPGALKAQTPSIVPVANSFNTTNVITPVLLAAGNYWLAYIPSSTALHFPSESTGGVTKQYPFTFGTLPSTYSTSPASSTWRWSLYATFTVSGGDTTPPSISLTTPVNGSVLSGTVTVSASASDASGIAGVQFKLDGANLGSEDTTSPYSVFWNTTTVADGPHSLTAVARDTQNNLNTSSTINCTVNNVAPDTTPPTVSLTAPTNGSVVSGLVTVSANAADANGLSGVQFKLDGANLGAEDTTAPYSIMWDSFQSTPGPHSLTALARDTSNNVRTSTSVNLTVNNVDVCP